MSGLPPIVLRPLGSEKAPPGYEHATRTRMGRHARARTRWMALRFGRQTRFTQAVTQAIGEPKAVRPQARGRTFVSRHAVGNPSQAGNRSGRRGDNNPYSPHFPLWNPTRNQPNNHRQANAVRQTNAHRLTVRRCPTINPFFFVNFGDFPHNP